ncbi:MAG: PRC-barrel domain containing protein [Desulfobacteraceae bacterium]|nr:MAG: PRC-barrel domain containing protein [Desulfobacteraceae bacterium]
MFLSLLGHTLVDRQMNNLGSIVDLVISQDGQVKYLTISRDRMRGIGAEQVAVPWEAAKLQRDADDLLMTELTQQQLEGAPPWTIMPRSEHRSSISRSMVTSTPGLNPSGAPLILELSF